MVILLMHLGKIPTHEGMEGSETRRMSRQVPRERRRPKAEAPRKNFLALYKAAVEAAHNAATVREALQIALDLVCAYTGWPVGHAYLRVDGSTDTLVSVEPSTRR